MSAAVARSGYQDCSAFFSPPFFGAWFIEFKSVATAVIEIPTPTVNGEFQTADILLNITRGGNSIIANQIFYNVPAAPSPLPGDPNLYPGLAPSLHFFLPGPGQEASGTVTMPENGAAPNYDVLLAAMQNVLNSEPGAGFDITILTREQSQHVAHEIIWNRTAFPLPVSNRSLEDIYTGPHSAGDDEERDRQLFEADLLTYYVKHNTEAERLANFVFSLSAALWCNNITRNAALAGFYFGFPLWPNHRKKPNSY